MRCGPSTNRFVKQLGTRLSCVTGDARESAWLRQRLVLAVILGNAASVLHSPLIPDPPDQTLTRSWSCGHRAELEPAEEGLSTHLTSSAPPTGGRPRADHCPREEYWRASSLLKFMARRVARVRP